MKCKRIIQRINPESIKYILKSKVFQLVNQKLIELI